ncbi:GtrA family protein [Granulicella cerasi]|uniref:GtrA family protein n=1 Tax=Granulicella cerasi TaxID=741063 RepID=A0ABW1Z6V9_9BACT|nr:bifunctional glycosyltransferase family 2/GtrA family protein [Granulicella cerasi]
MAPGVLGNIAALLPAWQPEHALLATVRELQGADFGTIVVVDDGSGEASQAIFSALREAGVPVLRHAVNLGKGRALKSGFNYILASYPQIQGVVTADADGQHLTQDILATAEALARSIHSQPTVTLGVRSFDTDVPFRSRFGNTLTRWIFHLVTGTQVTDTQTGLRGFPTALLPELLPLEGERYEYEMNVLTHLCRRGHRPLEVPIQTVYIDSNRSSHFNPIRDSMRIYFVLARFYFSSILAAVLDLLLFALAYEATKNLALSIVIGRTSSLLNFLLNRSFVFHNRGSVANSLLRYYALAACIAGLSYGLLWLLTHQAHWNIFVAKLCVDTPLSLVSFAVQRTFIFRRANRD